MHSLFGNAAAVATGIAAAYKVKGHSDVRVVAQGGDGGTTDIGLGCLSGMFERNDDVLYVCYDNEAYMNTGVSGPARRLLLREPQPHRRLAKNRARVRHRILYVATASVSVLRDLEYKVEKAMGTHGARYIHIHVPCPLSWGSESSDTIRIARLAVETGLFPLFEAEFGTVTHRTLIRGLTPVDEYLKLQKRFAHLFQTNADPQWIPAIQQSRDQTRNLPEAIRPE